MRLKMGKLKIWLVAHVHTILVPLIVIVLSLAGACNASHDSSTTISVIGSVVFDCNACSEHHLAFSGAHVAIKCQRGNDVSANGAGSVNDDGSFAIHLDKVELGHLCLAEVVMPNNKLCSLAKTSAPSTLEKLSVSTPLICSDSNKKLDQKFYTINTPIPKPNFNLLINAKPKPQSLSVTKFLKPKSPLKPIFFKPKPLPKFPPLPPILKPKPIIFKPKPLFKPFPKPFPKPKKFFKPKFLLKPLPKPLLVKPKSLPKFSPLPPTSKPKSFTKPKFFKPKPLLKPQPQPFFLTPKPLPKPPTKPKFYKPKPLLKPQPKPFFIKPKPLPKPPTKPKFFKPPSP